MPFLPFEANHPSEMWQQIWKSGIYHQVKGFSSPYKSDELEGLYKAALFQREKGTCGAENFLRQLRQMH